MDVTTEYLMCAVRDICLFLEDYLPLANAHVADFIIDGFWEKLLPNNIGQELLQLCHADLAKLPSGCLYQQDGAYLQGGTQLDDSLSRMEITWEKEPRTRDIWDKNRLPRWKHENLRDFIVNTQKRTLPFLKILTDLHQLQDTWKSETNDKVVIHQFMTAKKSHEVDVMAGVCASIARHVGAEKVIDIGSGRGYLSCHLHLMYGLSVLAIDSSTVNTDSAQLRGHRLQKHWSGIVRNAKTSQTVQEEATPGTSQHVSETKELKSSQNCLKPNDVKSGNATGSDNSVGSHKRFVNITQYVTPETDLLELLTTHLPDSSHHDERGDPVRGETVRGDPVRGERLLLTGLHTCGNLAPAMVEIFLHARGEAAALCNVGCCYHHLDEEFIRSPYQSQGGKEPEVYGFPLSDVLRCRGFQLGRNARMLASQTPARMAENGQLSHQSLYYRALLQVILRDVTGRVEQDWQVGKIYAKSKDFHDYVHRAFKKLNISHEVSRQVIDDYLQRYGHYEEKLSAFVQLRAALAPVIEALILVDRLLYLRQREEVAEAHLVQLFNEVTSPRCFGLIATRK